MRLVAAFVAGLSAFCGGTAHAGDMKMQSLDGTVTFTGSYGLTAIKANEYVYQGKAKLSQLIWESRYISTLNGAVDVRLPAEWYFKANASIGLGGDGHMADYDWLSPGSAWSDRSLHPDTRLNHYYSIGGEFGREVFSSEQTEIAVGLGFRYTDVKWSAWGGSYVYSSFGHRDDRGNFAADEKGISYRQSWPVPYLGINLGHNFGRWTFNGAFQGGLAINGRGTDDHWLRKLRFYDSFDTTPAIALSGSVDYAVWSGAAIYVGGSLDRFFRARGDTRMVNTVNGNEQVFRNEAGGDFLSGTLSLGIKGSF